MLDTKEIIDFFTLEQSHAKKELGQNFLINKKVCEEFLNRYHIQGFVTSSVYLGCYDKITNDLYAVMSFKKSDKPVYWK